MAHLLLSQALKQIPLSEKTSEKKSDFILVKRKSEIRDSLESFASVEADSVSEQVAGTPKALILAGYQQLSTNVSLTSFYRSRALFVPTIRTFKFNPTAWDLKSVINNHLTMSSVFDMTVETSSLAVNIDFKTKQGLYNYLEISSTVYCC